LKAPERVDRECNRIGIGLILVSGINTSEFGKRFNQHTDVEIFLDTIWKQSKNGMSNRQLVLKPHIAVMVF